MILTTQARVFHGDCLEFLPTLAAESVDMTVTSPPYDKVRDYDGAWKLDLPRVGAELYRVTCDGGVVALVMQDQTKNFAKSLTTFKTIVSWADAGFRLFECCIYSRSGTPGAWWNKRFRVDHEYIAIFFKGDRPQFFDKRHLMVQAVQGGRAKATGGGRRTDGTTAANTVKIINDKKCRGTVWDYTNDSKARHPIKSKHPATFPDRLASDLIQTFTKPGMVVLDPFAGSGTTLVQARALARHWIGCEINADYVMNIIQPLMDLQSG